MNLENGRWDGNGVSHYLHNNLKAKTTELRLVVLAWCGHILSYFELLPENIVWQRNMETYIESYHSSQLVIAKNNLDNIEM